MIDIDKVTKAIATRSTGISVGRYSDIVCKSIYTTIMHSCLGMLFESSRRVAGGNVDRISNAANGCESCELPKIHNYVYVVLLTKQYFHKLELFSIHCDLLFVKKYSSAQTIYHYLYILAINFRFSKIMR